MPWELGGLLDRDMIDAGVAALDLDITLQHHIDGITSPRLRVSALEAGLYMRNQLLRDTDWASMSHSVEVRVPFVDWTLWQKTAAALARSGFTSGPRSRRSTAASGRSARPRQDRVCDSVASWLEDELGPEIHGAGPARVGALVYARSTTESLAS